MTKALNLGRNIFMYKINFEKPIHVHFIGIGGISMSGLAEILLEEGFTVPVLTQKITATCQLEKKGAQIFYDRRPQYYRRHSLRSLYSGSQPG